MAIDDNTTYGLTGAQVKELPGKIEAVKGLAKVLTTADYNWPTTGTKTAVALWLLADGIYYAPEGVAIRRTSTTQGWTEVTYIITQGSTNTGIVTMGNSGIYHESANKTTGAQVKAQSSLIKKSEIINNLTSSYTDQPLSANQGKVLKDLIGDLTDLTTTDKTNLVAAINEAAAGGGGGVIELTSADYNYDEGNTGTNNCIAIWLLESGDYTIGGNTYLKIRSSINKAIFNTPLEYSIYKTADGTRIYTRVESTGKISSGMVAADGSNVTGEKTFLDQSRILQATGTSTSDIMSQNAVTSMVFQDPILRKRPQIGDSASATGNAAIAIGTASSATKETAIGIGYNSHATAKGAVAIGANSSATSVGEMNIGSSNTEHGYNSSNYRLLTGLYDPQSAHDAATKGYVDSIAPSITMTTTDPGEGAPLAANHFIGVYQ